MEEIWRKVCTHFDVPEDVTKSWYERIYQRLNEQESYRAYHNWQEMMLRKREDLQQVKPEIALAAFFQYYNYHGNRNCNEDNCAAFEEFCIDAMIEEEESKCLILRLLGEEHNESELSPCYENEANLLQDLDLAILAAPPVEYKHYTQLLRQEYAHLSDASFKHMRLKVLETLLLIPNIFSTENYHEKYEQAARANIREEITFLKQ